MTKVSQKFPFIPCIGRAFARQFLVVGIFLSIQAGLVAREMHSANTKSREVSIVLPDGDKIEASRTFAQDLGKGNFSWNGKIQDTGIGYLTFSKVDGKIRGTINRIGETSLSFSEPMKI